MSAQPEIIVNRASRIIASAFHQIAGQLLPFAYLRPFSYWDAYYGTHPDITPSHFRLLNYKCIQGFDNKGFIARKVRDMEIAHLFPPGFFSVGEALDYAQNKDCVWFIKPTYSTGGKGIHCLTTNELASYELPPHHFIQQQVDDIELVDGKKYTARAYVFVHDQKVFLFDDGFVMIHGKPYDPKATDFATQIDHRGYHEAGSAIKMMRMTELPELERKRAELQKAIILLKPILADFINASSKTEYGLLGVDLLFKANHEVRLIEVNSKSNFVHTELINNSLNVPFFAALLSQLYTGSIHPRFTQI
ncbi:hypothetical protein [Pseudidiomarina insulisalsae]|uniref:ATP-grasp domain-containing protein n=1 Tax=Pseudidiomarina insulisalsae TaxID=575789 RepID=A0A432YNT2_9GAMM|nr:hypothetical protein [Pseudidiomarina insulisalsae]RUO62515.1 hypothetical protein CWI71_03515 [Pseudidiomarina insulisalsae]